MLGSGGILGKPCGLPAPQDIFDRNIVAQINLGSEYKISRGKFPRLIFSCPVPSGLPHRSHCVPMNMNRWDSGVFLRQEASVRKTRRQVRLLRMDVCAEKQNLTAEENLLKYEVSFT